METSQKRMELVERSEYRDLYLHVCLRPGKEWRTTFGEIEDILGFELPASARKGRDWWSNLTWKYGRPIDLSWAKAGWQVAEVDPVAETLVFRWKEPAKTKPKRRLEDVWPAHPTARWPEGGLSLRREDIYEDRVFCAAMSR